MFIPWPFNNLISTLFYYIKTNYSHIYTYVPIIYKYILAHALILTYISNKFLLYLLQWIFTYCRFFFCCFKITSTSSYSIDGIIMSYFWSLELSGAAMLCSSEQLSGHVEYGRYLYICWANVCQSLPIFAHGAPDEWVVSGDSFRTPQAKTST